MNVIIIFILKEFLPSSSFEGIPVSHWRGKWMKGFEDDYHENSDCFVYVFVVVHDVVLLLWLLPCLVLLAVFLVVVETNPLL